MRGAIWYQGESNASRAHQYRTIFPMLIREWRSKWNAGWRLEGDNPFPFYFVQLANYKAGEDPPGESDWAELREAQLMTHRKLPNTGMAVTIDIGNPEDIHPKNKQDVGKRLARWALAKDYGRDLVHSGPLYLHADFHQRHVTIRFEHVGEGLEAKGGKLKGFEIAGSDREFHPAQARIIDDDTIRVFNKQTRGFNDPVAVRYGWEDNPEECNLYNSAGLPASPFRTDDWPGSTKDNP
jgi:sialate O-acetylesterase